MTIEYGVMPIDSSVDIETQLNKFTEFGWLYKDSVVAYDKKGKPMTHIILIRKKKQGVN